MLFIKCGFLCHVCVYNGVGLQVLPFTNNRHLGSMYRLRRFSCVLLFNAVTKVFAFNRMFQIRMP